MSNVLGVLTIDLTANTSSFTSEMGKMESLSLKTSSSIKRSLETIGVAGLAMATAVVGGLAGIVTKSVEAVTSMERLAQASGSTVEGFSLLAYAAKRTNTESETLAGGLEKLSKAAFGAQNGNKELGNAFSRLGISTVDANGHLRDSSDIFQQVAVKFAGMSDGAGKTALAIMLFGKSGASLIPALNDIGEHLAQITAEAKRYGLVIGGETSANAKQFEEGLKRLKAGFEGMGIQLTAALLPALLNLEGKLEDLSNKANLPELAKSFGKTVSDDITAISDGLSWCVKNAGALKVALEALIALKLSSIAIPLIGQLVAGGAANIGSAIDKITISLFNLKAVLPAIATLGGPITVAIAALIALGVALIAFRNTTLSMFGTTYQLRDTWNAAWIFMGKGVGLLSATVKAVATVVRNEWKEVVTDLGGMWDMFVNYVGGNAFLQAVVGVFSQIVTFISSQVSLLVAALGSIAPQWVKDMATGMAAIAKGISDGVGQVAGKVKSAWVDSLDQAKHEREMKDGPKRTEPEKAEPKTGPNTSGYGVKPDTTQDKDIVADAITKLKEERDAARDLFAQYDKGADAIEKVNEKNKATAQITDLNIKLSDKYKEYLSLEQDKKAQQALWDKMTAEERVGYMTADNEATLRATVATTMRTAANNAFGATLIEQVRSSDLATTQTLALGDATLKGSEAVRQATIDNTMLGLASGKTAEQLAVLATNFDTIRASAAGLAGATLTKSFQEQTKSIDDEITTQRLLIPALLAGADAVEAADLATKLRTIDTELSTSKDKDAIAAAQKAKDALQALTKANHGVKIAGEAGGGIAKYNYQAQLDHLREISAEYQKQIHDGKDILANALALRDAASDSLKIQIAQNDAEGKSHNNAQNQLTVMQGKQTLQGWNQIGSSDIGADIEKSLEALPQELGNTISNAVFNHRKGDSTGKQLGELFRNLGKNLLGDVAGKLIEKLAAEIAVHVLGIQIQATATTALAANTAAIVANTAAQAVSGAGSAVGGAAGGVGSAVGGIAGSAGGAAGSAASGLIGPLIAAAGGIIGGIISGVMSMIGDNKIVAAVNGTTSAVNALGARLGGTYATSTSSTGLTTNSTAPTTAPSPTNGIPFIGGFLQSLFGFGGGSNATPVPVSIVSVSPVSPLSGFFKMLGFANGGRPQPGVPYLTGEKGVELRVDDGPGSIIPNHDVAGYLNNGSSQSGSNTDGHHTFHIYEANSPRETARQVAVYLKNANPKFSQFSH